MGAGAGSIVAARLGEFDGRRSQIDRRFRCLVVSTVISSPGLARVSSPRLGRRLCSPGSQREMIMLAGLAKSDVCARCTREADDDARCTREAEDFAR